MKRGMYMFGLLALFGVVFAAAATLNLTGGTIQVGTDVDLTCDDEVNVDGWGLESDTGLVNFVRIHNISVDCVGNDLFVNITQGGVKIAGGSATIPADADAADNDPDGGEVGVKVNFPAQSAEFITDIQVFIEGPSP